ncbi:hypothetical protein PC119_g15816 [Phytophthora cactorum]|nr:hypothetical protein PC119_g15816 [Phytophthora cactorum]
MVKGEEAKANGAGRKLSPMRFMQMALATTVLFSVAYMYQFVSVSISLRSAGDSDDEEGGGLVRNRVLGHSVLHLQGFEAGHKFVSEYDVETQGPLYILFMSDADENGKYWCPDCERAKKPVMDAFNRAPRGSRLVEIRVGPQSYWADYMNEFRQNQLFYLDHIPTLMRYEGGGNSSTMLTESFCTDPDLLDYVFRVNKPLAGEPNKNKVLTMYSPGELIDYLGTYDNSYPLFLFFVSGYHEFNGRLWCPYCDRADVAVMHYYNYTAPDNAVLVRVVVSTTYKQWKKKKNPFKQPEFQEKVAPVRGVPFLGFVKKDVPANKINVHQFMPDYPETNKLKTHKKRVVGQCYFYSHSLLHRRGHHPGVDAQRLPQGPAFRLTPPAVLPSVKASLTYRKSCLKRSKSSVLLPTAFSEEEKPTAKITKVKSNKKKEDSKPVQKNRRRCWECKVKVGLTAVNFKTAGKRKLEEENPVVVPPKVARIN